MYYYRVNVAKLTNLRPTPIDNGIYKGCYEIHLLADGIEDPSSIPIRLNRRIPWEQPQRSDILRGTTVSIWFPNGDRTYETITDCDTPEGHLIIVAELGTFRHYSAQ